MDEIRKTQQQYKKLLKVIPSPSAWGRLQKELTKTFPIPPIGSIENKLQRKAMLAIQNSKKVREPKIEDIFTRRYYISPEQLIVDNYIRSKPLAAFNPGALLSDEKCLIFPRLVFDYYSYVSSVGMFSVNIEEVISGRIKKPLRTKIILWPEELWELTYGCQDPRVTLLDDRIYMLYAGNGHAHRGSPINIPIQSFVELDLSFKVKRKGYFSITGDEDHFVPMGKDSAFIEIENTKATILTRPVLPNAILCWTGKTDLENLTIPENSMKPVLLPESWENHVGWSTNVVKLSPGKYIVGWHGVLRENLSYRNGLAIVSENGKLLATTDYILSPKGLNERYGDTPIVSFGCGLIRYKEYLIWIGGICDYGIGIFITELEEVLKKLKWVK